MRLTTLSVFTKKWVPAFFVTALFITTVLMFIPGKPPKQDGFMHWDKIQHATVFMLLIKLAWLAYPNKKLFTAIALVIFGAVIEILQTVFTSTRIGSTADWIADIVGIMLGMSICALLLSKNRLNKLADDTRI